ncbi:MAG: indolepyruvate ferredoxin oxidoreductase subunit alpha [Oscillospiraceae bacterium]|jgi:indolepyruvate ferredoxin oxidoreductase alpha subunit|nr:indolepyruvate ferredoxin oxidoreductase subunit alpha [Oscillospiraceae bacterium]
MAKQLLMGNQAIALGAIRAGVKVVTGYPGTPSTEVLETVAEENNGNVYVEWSVNEKSALEVAAGAAYSGARSMVTMKQVGLNVASDPLMSLAYIGVKAGMVILVADDPGPISSQTEQDTRHFAFYSKLPVFDPSTPEEAYTMIGDAFDYSEKYQTPVLFRPTTRLCHGCAAIETDSTVADKPVEGFIKDTSKWVIFPKTTYRNHIKIEERNPKIGEDFSSYKGNSLTGDGKKGIATGGVCYQYVKEALSMLSADGDCKLLKLATVHPFPETLALSFFDGLEEVLVVEELDPVIEKQLIFLCGKHGIKLTIHGKLDRFAPTAGESSVELCLSMLSKFLGKTAPALAARTAPPPLPVRPPVLCAGCPHRASFYTVKRAMKGRKAVFSGDIGCYTLGNAMPLDMVDTCLCMGAGITVAQGIHRAEPDTVNFAFVGDSTFFHTGIPGILNAVYNQTKIVVMVLDNSTTAMTGHQPHPGTGMTMMGEIAQKISIPDMLRAMGVTSVEVVDPLDLKETEAAVRRAAECEAVSAVICKSPCIAVTKPKPSYTVDAEKCTNCKVCIKQLGCPAIVKGEGKAEIDRSLCYGCGICEGICPFGAIGGEK